MADNYTLTDNNFSGRGWMSRGPFFGGFNAAQNAAQTGSQMGLQQEAGREAMGQLGATQAGENYRAQLAADAQKYAANLHAQQFNKLFGTLSGALGNFGGGGGGNGSGAMYGGGGFAGFPAAVPSPTISVGPVYTPQQIQQQVNAARAHNDTQLGTQLKQQQGEMANRGFAQGSPLQQALANQSQIANMVSNTQAGTQIPWEAAQANANQVLSTQQARESQYATRQKEVIEKANAQNQYRGGLLSALASLL